MAKNNNHLSNLLNFGMWNVQGLTQEKNNDPNFNNTINKFSIISFVETWSGEIHNANIPNFEFIHSNYRKKHKKAKRYSGGISIF